MSGLGKSARNVGLTGNSVIDGVMTGRAWTDSVITYSFPTSATAYATIYDATQSSGAFPDAFSALSDLQAATIRRVLDSSHVAA